MGGYGSGQWVRTGTKRSTSSAIALDICALTQHGLLGPSRSTTATSTWSNSRTGETIGTVEHTIRAERDRGEMELRYWSNDFGESVQVQSIVTLETTHPHFGGVRWWFRCPLSGKRSRVLYKISGERYFACRDALGLTYDSCNEDAQSQALRQSRKIRKRMGQGCVSDRHTIRPKPKGMHWETFSREMQRAWTYEEKADRIWTGQVAAMFGMRI